MRIGSGHLVRCSTLAAELVRRGAAVHLVGRGFGQLPAWLIDMFPGQMHELPVSSGAHDSDLAHSSWLEATQSEDAEQTLKLAGLIKPEWIVVDHYGIDARWHRAVAGSTRSMMVIDDLADRQLEVDLLLDPNRDESVAREAYGHCLNDAARILGGPQWTLLRREFLLARDTVIGSPERNRIVILLGGLGSPSLAENIFQAFMKVQRPLVVDVIHGDPGTAGDIGKCAERCRLDVTVHTTPSRVSEIMSRADLAVSTAGGTTWELACLGVPSVLLPVAGNQSVVGEQAVQAGFAVQASLENPEDIAHLTGSLLGDSSRLTEMSEAGRDFIDGRGAERVVDTMLGS
ncbi:MAG: UDP-2,4-diacetamido-2,4,6-trideoxy-beta-L-altropyranose hydrolase [Phycisphaerales bacterium]|nr:UDP-2,4-diacetamido-2,4,6-trideoxy-beta-L-altropyranose hydrolase [Phycisphaerales bacterium]MCH2153963.1 UDP-2,4-diacetamido-2,4,6-trideoxy-beta-L-altropyranose hydrolase [Phycisphaerales bacterium]